MARTMTTTNKAKRTRATKLLETGVSVPEVAKRLGVTKGTIYRWKGYTAPYRAVAPTITPPQTEITPTVTTTEAQLLLDVARAQAFLDGYRLGQKTRA